MTLLLKISEATDDLVDECWVDTVMCAVIMDISNLDCEGRTALK